MSSLVLIDCGTFIIIYIIDLHEPGVYRKGRGCATYETRETCFATIRLELGRGRRAAVLSCVGGLIALLRRVSIAAALLRFFVSTKLRLETHTAFGLDPADYGPSHLV